MISRAILFITLLCSFTASPTDAAIVTRPPGLQGNSYRLAFVTSGTMDALSTDIADYDAFVQSAADSVGELANLNLTWQVIGSVPGLNARDHTGTHPSSAGVPIYLLDGTLLANGNSDLWDGSIASPLAITELGTTLNATVWTGTRDVGVGARPLGLSAFTTTYGDSSAFLNDDWINAGVAQDESLARSFYALSGEITAVPEPNSIVLLLGLAGFTAICGRRRRHAKLPTMCVVDVR